MFDFSIHVLTIACIFALFSLSLNIQAGYAGLLNFGHIVFVGIGAYAVGIGHTAGFSLLTSVISGCLVASILGWGMTRIGSKLATDYWGIATLAIAEIIRIFALNQINVTGGAEGISSLPSPADALGNQTRSLVFFIFCLICVLLFGWISIRISTSRFGRALRLMRDEPQLANCLGYNIQSLKAKAIMTSSVLASLGGAILACYTRYVSPDYMLSSQTFLIWGMLMIGGIGNVTGVVLGSLLVEFIYAFIPFVQDYIGIDPDLAGSLRLGLIGVLLLAFLMWRTEGIVPEKPRIIR